MTGKQLTPQNATITTATIQVQALTIGKRQVTLAVFRQLEDEDIIKPLDAGLAGEPWGRVNYHPDKCSEEKAHIHVVWQRDDELRRATVYEPSVAAYKHPTAGLYVEALIAEGLDHRDPRASTAGGADRIQVVKAGREDGVGFTRFTHHGVQFHGPVRSEFLSVFRNHYVRRDEGENLWQRVRHVAGPEATSESIAAGLPVLAYNTSWRQLKDLPQLFIAV
ncbi:hypothetical protein IQ62_33900 [Streptomyces scabiei]|uniref:hypothetical protein n=1 Tax=Streptomyces scabiei TaxID=1930 RepID=UPI0004E73E34|nr:hypothetical protein [Streptomyces scabiei]KFF96915.1 hypothetical protein IQ62_33900 [Streptomyces scabiei]